MAFTHRGDAFSPEYPHQHDTVAQAWECEALAAQEADQIEAELAAEARNERFWEERGGWDREEELARMSEACGLPIPPGMY